MMFALDSSSTVSEPRIEFWWIKPQPKNPRALEPGYLKYQVSQSTFFLTSLKFSERQQIHVLLGYVFIGALKF